MGPPQVAFAAPSPGRFGPPGPSLVSASGFSSFIFWGGVSFAYRGDQAWRPPRHALGHPPSRPCANFEDRAFQVGEGGSQKGSWRSSDRRVGAGVPALGPGRRGPPLLGLSRSPQGQALEDTSPRGRCSEKERCSGWPVPFECGFSFSFPLLLPPTPPPFFSNRSLFMIAWITEEIGSR